MPSEFPGTYPDLLSYVRASSAIKYQPHGGDGILDLRKDSIPNVMSLFTPQSILEQVSHATEPISIEIYSTFDNLIVERERIRKLELLPKRADTTQREFEYMSKNTFLSIVNSYYVNDAPLALVRELYTYELTEQIGQYVIWVRDDNLSDALVAQFIGGIMENNGLNINDVIFFERSKMSETNFARVSVPERRHIHMLTRDTRLLRSFM